ncbi:MAG: hypothetical protein ACOY5Y_04905 [Pseudomonadota bacterium]|jgi:hypothetical protein
MGTKAALAAVALSAMAGNSAMAQAPMDAERARAAFTVDLPTGCELRDGALRAEFAVFYVYCGGQFYAGIYAGNAADREVPRSRLMLTEHRWPAEVQAWAAEVPGDQAKADAIAASVRVRRVRIALG